MAWEEMGVREEGRRRMNWGEETGRLWVGRRNRIVGKKKEKTGREETGGGGSEFEPCLEESILMMVSRSASTKAGSPKVKVKQGTEEGIDNETMATVKLPGKLNSVRRNHGSVQPL